MQPTDSPRDGTRPDGSSPKGTPGEESQTCEGGASAAGEVPASGGSAETILVPRASQDPEATLIVPISGVGSPAGKQREQVRYFGNYELVHEIARGGMGVVYKAVQLNLNRTVALKMILAGQLASSEDVSRFYIEAEAAANLDHPGIVPIYEIGTHENQHFFTMGYVDGQSLQQLVRQGPLPPARAAELMRKIAEAIGYAHDKGVIHRDLKPANVLLDRHGEPRVTDFGLARRLENESDLTQTGRVMGTPSYMPPEQAMGKSGEVGPLSDVYSLGAMLYCLLTGRPPFQSANKYDIVMQVIERDPIPPRRMDPKIDRDLETICLKCLAKDPADRYRSAHELEADLGRFLNDQPILARPPGVWESAQQWARNNAVTVTTLVMILASSAIMLPLLAVAFRNQAGRAVSAAEGIPPVKSVTESEVSQARAVVREMTRQLATEPGNPALLGERARALIMSGDDLAAIKDLDTLIDGNGEVSEWRQLRAEIALRAGRPQDAIADLTSVLEHQPDHFASLSQRAQARLDAAFLVGALDDVNLALRLRPGTARLFLLRAKIQARLGDRASARRDRERARTLGLEKEG